MVSANNKGHPNLTPQRSLEYPLVLDKANIANSRYPTNSKMGPDARTLKEMCPRCHQIVPKRRFSSTAPKGEPTVDGRRVSQSQPSQIAPINNQ